jgi:hypothetical protein
MDDEADSAAASQAIHDVVASVRTASTTLRPPRDRPLQRTAGSCLIVRYRRIGEVPVHRWPHPLGSRCGHGGPSFDCCLIS